MWHDTAGGIKVWEGRSWEEGAWEISECFAVKWWLLMADEVLRGMNMLKGTEGEPTLVVEGGHGS